MRATSLQPCAFNALLVSEAIRPLLGVAGRARVQGVYRSAVNVESDIGMLTLGLVEIGRLPNGITVDGPIDFLASGLRTGLPVLVDSHRLVIPGVGLVIDLEGAERWSPRLSPAGNPDGRALVNGRALWGERSGRIRQAVAMALGRRDGSSAGLGALLSSEVPSSTVARRALPALRLLATALSNGNSMAAATAAAALVGLGPGLTPSGDDALVGVAAAQAALGSGPATFLDLLARERPSRTTAVATMFLRHAACGEFAGRLHDLLRALLGGTTDGALAAIDRTISWGATSGVDTLVGVLVGLDALSGLAALPDLAPPARRRAA